ncbi:MAG: DUF1178 family protein [bacterium]
MIRYTLTCASDHSFESWFQSALAFDGLVQAGCVNCPVCGSGTVSKSLMAPSVQLGRDKVPSLTTPANDRESALAALRAEVEAKSDYVGVNFVTEARAMHQGDVPERSIYGEARPEEAIKLLEDGVPVAPLPFMPVRKVN